MPPQNQEPRPTTKPSIIQTIEQYSFQGDLINVFKQTANDEFKNLPIATRRQLIGRAFQIAAEIRDSNTAQGIRNPLELTDQDFAEKMHNLSSRLRNIALDILLNPDGKSLEDQIAELRNRNI